MKKSSVYIDTTIPSYYYEQRDDPIIYARHLITVNWWDAQAIYHDLFVSEFVLGELMSGNYPNKDEVVNLVRKVSPEVLPLSDTITEIAETFMEHGLMPQKDVADSFHLAFTAYYKIDYLLTWNCNHLANANKQEHITRLLTRLHLFVPVIVTPEMLFEEEN